MNLTDTQLTQSQANALAGFTVGAMFFFITLLTIIIIITIIGKWKTYNKASQPGWAAIIPFYADFILVKVAKMKWWNFLIFDAFLILYALQIKNISTVAWIAYFAYSLVINIKLCKAFNRGAGLGIVCALFPFIGYMILGCGSAKYEG